MIRSETQRSRFEAGMFLICVVLPLVFVPAAIGPFSTIKVIVLLLGALLAWSARQQIPRIFVVLVTGWLVASALAGVAGVDPYFSLMGLENEGSGLFVLLGAGLLLLCGLTVPDELAQKMARWVAWIGVIVSVIAVINRLAPGAVQDVTFDIPMDGSTLGQRVHLGAFIAAALVMLLGAGLRRHIELMVLAILASALSVSSNRAGLVGLAAGLVFTVVRGNVTRARATTFVTVLVLVFAAWTAVDYGTGHEQRYTGVTRFDEGATVHVRLAAWETSWRAWTDRPVFGWGTANTGSGYLANAKPSDIRRASRGVNDAHNLLVETAVTTGLAGLLPLLALLTLVAHRAWRMARENAWMFGAALAFMTSQLLQPIHVVITPMLFLFMGLAARTRVASIPDDLDPPRSTEQKVILPWVFASVFVGGVLVVGLALSGLRMVASVYEFYGRRESSQPALRTALRLEPRRLSAAQKLLIEEAVDWRLAFQRPDLRSEIKASIDRRSRLVVNQHPWSLTSRIAAANAAVLTEDFAEADRWFARQLDRFPNDTIALDGRAFVAVKRGDWDAAERFAKQALETNPNDKAAKQRLIEAENGREAELR